MKIHCRLIQLVAGVMALTGLATITNAAVTLPVSAALPTNSVSNPGFVVRSAQASTSYVIANSVLRASRQINGLLTDSGGAAITNIAIPGPNALGAYFTDVVDFEKDGAPVDIRDTGGVAILDQFGSELFPGIPGDEGETTQFADESVALVHLTAGTHTLAMSTAADTTAANDDDGYAVYVGANPRDLFATRIAEFQRAGVNVVGNHNVENLIEVTAPIEGAYPFRILHWQQSRGSSLHFYTVDSNTGVRSLINDQNNATALRAYRASTNAAYNSPYVGQLSPVPDSAGNSGAAPIIIVLFDGTPNTVNTNIIQLSLNGLTVIPQSIIKTGNKTTIEYNPQTGRTDVNNLMRLVFSNSSGASYTNTWSFAIVTVGGSVTVTGQWDFDFGDLRPTVGAPLEYFDPNFDGPAGFSGNKTVFGTTSSFGISDINGQVANVMQVPGDLDRQIGYIMTHGIAPNGGGTKVNQYTLIMDIMVDNAGPGATTLLQISSLSNTDDGDLFWQNNQFGQGNGGYIGTGAFTPLVWHRIAAAYNEAASPPVVTKYVDGILQHDWTANQGLDHARRALQPTAILFGDGDQDERRTMWVNSIQIRNGALSKAELAALSRPTANGIPGSIPMDQPPEMRVGRIGNGLTLTWPLSATGYTLKSTPSLASPAVWTPVSGVLNNSVAVTVGSGNQFFRLEK